MTNDTSETQAPCSSIHRHTPPPSHPHSPAAATHRSEGGRLPKAKPARWSGKYQGASRKLPLTPWPRLSNALLRSFPLENLGDKRRLHLRFPVCVKSPFLLGTSLTPAFNFCLQPSAAMAPPTLLGDDHP